MQTKFKVGDMVLAPKNPSSTFLKNGKPMLKATIIRISALKDDVAGQIYEIRYDRILNGPIIALCYEKCLKEVKNENRKSLK